MYSRGRIPKEQVKKMSDMIETVLQGEVRGKKRKPAGKGESTSPSKMPTPEDRTPTRGEKRVSKTQTPRKQNSQASTSYGDVKRVKRKL